MQIKLHASTCPRDTIICLPDDKMASAETLNWLELLLKHERSEP